MSELSRQVIVPNTWLAAHHFSGADMNFLHNGMPVGSSYYVTHRHVIREDWSVQNKNKMADHIDGYHTPPKTT